MYTSFLRSKLFILAIVNTNAISTTLNYKITTELFNNT